MANLSWSDCFQIRPARPGDGVKLARVLRAQDKSELAATHPGQNVGKCLEKFIKISRVSVFVSYRGRPFLLAGIYCDDVFAQPALVWLLTGREVNKHPISFFKMGRFFLAQWQAYYGDLFNYIDARYTSACQFAKRLGGRMENDGTYYQGKLFLKCIFRRNLWGE